MADDFDPENPPAVPNVPVTFTSGGQTLSATSLVKEATPGEVSLFANQRVKTCGDYKFFQHDDKTKKKLQETDLFRKLKHEYKWKSRYLPGKFEDLGICRQKQDTVIGPTSRACEYYKGSRF